MKKIERERKEAKETLENLTSSIQNSNKARPRKARVTKKQTVTPTYEYEYEKVQEDDDLEDLDNETE